MSQGHEILAITRSNSHHGISHGNNATALCKYKVEAELYAICMKANLV